MASKPNNIRCIGTGSQPYWKIMYIIVLQNFPEILKLKLYISLYQFYEPGPLDLKATKTKINLVIFSFTIRGKLSVIRCDQELFWCWDISRLSALFLHFLGKANIVLLWRHKFWDRRWEGGKKISSKEIPFLTFMTSQQDNMGFVFFVNVDAFFSISMVLYNNNSLFSCLKNN